MHRFLQLSKYRCAVSCLLQNNFFAFNAGKYKIPDFAYAATCFKGFSLRIKLLPRLLNLHKATHQDWIKYGHSFYDLPHADIILAMKTLSNIIYEQHNKTSVLSFTALRASKDSQSRNRIWPKRQDRIFITSLHCGLVIIY